MSTMHSAHATLARELLTRLLEETQLAQTPEITADVDALERVLAARGELLEALERSVQALATGSRATRGGAGQGSASSRDGLLALARELERANTQLSQSVRIERDLIGAALAAADRPDAVASSYGAGTPAERPHFDLRR